MRTKMRKILAILIGCAALASAQGPRRAPGFALPDIQMLTGHGGKFHDLADFRGKVVVLEFRSEERRVGKEC